MKQFYLTQQRLEILRLLHRAGALTAEQIAANVKIGYPLVVLEKFLDELTETGLLKKDDDRYHPGRLEHYRNNRIEILEILAFADRPLKGSEIDRQLTKPIGITNIGAILERLWMEGQVERQDKPYRYILTAEGREVLQLLGRIAA